MDLDEMFHRTQERLAILRRHRREVANESPAERALRQRARADEVLRGLVGSRRVSPAFRRWALALVIADEAPDPPGDPVPPKAPGARAVLKSAKPTKAKPQTHEGGLW